MRFKVALKLLSIAELLKVALRQKKQNWAKFPIWGSKEYLRLRRIKNGVAYKINFRRILNIDIIIIMEYIPYKSLKTNRQP